MESLATKYRPSSFSDVVGQSSIVKILERQIETGQFKNCYLFCGPSGCGKTTIARIFAKRINGGIGEPIEIDAASNNGVDNVKTLVEEANQRSVYSKYKIIIMDECHSLTNQAWQAFLKCIEEPPAFTIFIFATTDPQKIPPTIINRCMRFDFQKIPTSSIENRLREICSSEGFVNFEEAISLISKSCKNQCRDAISLLDKASSYSSDFSLVPIKRILGLATSKDMVDLTNSIIDGNESLLVDIFENRLYGSGVDIRVFVDQYLSFLINVFKYILFNSIAVTDFTESDEVLIKGIINFNDPKSFYTYLMDKTLELKNTIKNDTNCMTTVEVAFLQMCRLK